MTETEYMELEHLVSKAGALTPGPVGIRELLLAAALHDPKLVAGSARAQKINPGRLAWALSEWWVTSQTRPENTRTPLCDPKAIRLLRRAVANAEAASPKRTLVDLVWRECLEQSSTHDSDPTAAVLRALRIT